MDFVRQCTEHLRFHLGVVEDVLLYVDAVAHEDGVQADADLLVVDRGPHHFQDHEDEGGFFPDHGELQVGGQVVNEEKEPGSAVGFMVGACQVVGKA